MCGVCVVCVLSSHSFWTSSWPHTYISVILVLICCTTKNKAEYQVSVKHPKVRCFSCMHVFSPTILHLFVRFVHYADFVTICTEYRVRDLSMRFSEPKIKCFRWCTSLGHLQKRKTLRYICVMTVIGSRVCASSTVSFSRGVQRG